MDVNHNGQPWKKTLGEQLKAARIKAGKSQIELGQAVGRKRQSIINYENGTDAPHVDILGKIALELDLPEVRINGHRFSITQADTVQTPPPDQLRLDFDKEYVYPGATIKITPRKVSITITAVAAVGSR